MTTAAAFVIALNVCATVFLWHRLRSTRNLYARLWERLRRDIVAVEDEVWAAEDRIYVLEAAANGETEQERADREEAGYQQALADDPEYDGDSNLVIIRRRVP